MNRKPEEAARKTAEKGVYAYRKFHVRRCVGTINKTSWWVITGASAPELTKRFNMMRDAQYAIDDFWASKPGDGHGKVTSRRAQDRTKNGSLGRGRAPWTTAGRA